MSDFDGKIEFEKFPPAYRLMIKYTELQDRIDKAIEYIEQNCIDDEFYINLTRKEKEIIKVLDILKGSDKE